MAKKLKKLLKKVGKAALIGGALYGGSKLLKGRRNKAIDMGIAAADEEPGASIKDFGPFSKAANFIPKKRTPVFTGDQTMTSDYPFKMMANQPNQRNVRKAFTMQGDARGYTKGGRVTGIAKRGFGRALMKGKK